MSEFKVGDKVFIEANILRIEGGNPPYFWVETWDGTKIWVNKVYSTKTYDEGLNDGWNMAKKTYYKCK